MMTKAGDDVEKRSPYLLLVGLQLLLLPWKSAHMFLKKLETDLLYDSAIP